MSNKPLDTIGGVGGGPVRLVTDNGRARNIHVSIANPTAATHGVAFGRSQREITDTMPNGGLPGFVVPAVPNTVANATIGTIAYTNFLLQAWVGELWAITDISGGIIRIDVLDSSSPEK